MKAKVLDLTLPEWAWISGGEHDEGGDQLADRVVACHIRSASMIEFFLEERFFPANPSVKTYSFTYENVAGIKEKHIAVLHYCAVTDDEEVIERRSGEKQLRRAIMTNEELWPRKEIGKQIREAREKAGLTTRQLAEMAGLAQSHIVRIENGRYSVTIDTLSAIARALGLSIRLE